MARSYILAFLFLFIICAGGFVAFQNKPALVGYYKQAMNSIRPVPKLPPVEDEVTLDTPEEALPENQPVVISDPAKPSGLERVNDTLASIVERLDSIENRIDDLKAAKKQRKKSVFVFPND